jgi:hypothetical protein
MKSFIYHYIKVICSNARDPLVLLRSGPSNVAVSSPFFALHAIELSGAYLISETLMGISKKETQIDVECSGPHAPAGLEGATFHCLEPEDLSRNKI